MSRIHALSLVSMSVCLSVCFSVSLSLSFSGVDEPGTLGASGILKGS